MKQNTKLTKMIFWAMMVAVGVVISPLLRIEGMCPMAHFINVTCAVLLGPWYAFLCALAIGLIRMAFMGIPPLALTGAVFGAPLHFIGHLQRNKVKQVVGKAALIQSAGSVELLEEIEKQAEKLDIVQDILLEVNIGGEAAKSGFAPEAVEAAAAHAKELPHVRVRGLMTIPPAGAARDENMVYFEKVHALYVDINQKMYNNELDYLSMGMSGDFADAIRAGSNMVRVGTAIFGARDYTK